MTPSEMKSTLDNAQDVSIISDGDDTSFDDEDDMQRSPSKVGRRFKAGGDDGGYFSLLGEFDEHRYHSWWSLRGLLEVLGFIVLLVTTLLQNKPASTEDKLVPKGSIAEKLRGSPAPPQTGDNHRLLVASYRQRAGDISVELMLEELKLREQDSREIDIGKFADLVDECLDAIGVRGCYDDVFNVYALAVALNDGFAEKGLSPDIVAIMKDGHQGPYTTTPGRLPGQERGVKALKVEFWWPHWLGALTADKLLRDGGSLRLSKDSNKRIDAVGYFQEIYQMTSQRKYPDILPYHAVHGFWWQYIASTRPNIDEYPTDLYESFCEPWMEGSEELDFNDFVQDSMWRECRHGVGHAIFYTMIVSREHSFVVSYSL